MAERTTPSSHALASSRERGDLYRLLVERVQDYAIFALDTSGRILTWNAGAHRLKGYTPDEAIGRHFSMFYLPEDLAADKPGRMLAEAREKGHVEDEGWRRRKDGTVFWASVVITALRNDEGTLTGFGKVTRDLTERRTIADLTKRSEDAETANRLKSEFLAAMSHELRTPLNAIGGYAQLLEMEVSGPITGPQREHLARIKHSQEHLLGIINDILNFSRIEAGQVTYDIGPVVIDQVMHEVAAMLAPQMRAKGIALRVADCPPDVVAVADKSKVEQILINLLSNAAKFTSAGGVIELTCDAAEDRVCLGLRDTGTGIPDDKLEVIFAPFVQVGRGLSTPKEGTGLGLAISRDLARAMGGDLTVTSAVGVGSTFTLRLPRYR